MLVRQWQKVQALPHAERHAVEFSHREHTPAPERTQCDQNGEHSGNKNTPKGVFLFMGFGALILQDELTILCHH